MISIIASSAPGLSPLARGTLVSVQLDLYPARFIPAGAGNTQTITRVARGSSVYPRWRGEHYQTGIFPYNGGGLSPLARGTLTRRGIRPAPRRFIPAGAGNTAADSRADHHRPVYPRWRGEHLTHSERCMKYAGLSPLARGTLVSVQLDLYPARFIPAGAGNTLAVVFTQ